MTNELEERYGPCEIRTPSSRADNQYTLIKTKAGAFYVLFEDGEGNEQESKITEEIYLEMLQQARNDDAKLRWDKRHLDDSADVNTLPDRLYGDQRRSVEEAVIAAVLLGNESKARRAVSDLQWRRIKMRFELGMTLDEIAEAEGRTKMPISRSIEDAIEKIKKILK